MLAPLTAAAANLSPVVDSVSFSSAPVQAGSTVIIQCAAHDESTVTTMQVTVTGGTLPGGVTTAAISLTPAASVVGSIAWAVPAAGLYTVTCTVRDDGVGGSFGPKAGTRAQPVTVVAPAGSPPVIDSLVASASQVKVGGVVQLTAAAHDPDGDPLTWSWTANLGTLAASGNSGNWTAPATTGSATVTLVVSDGQGNSATALVAISVRLALYAGGMPAMLVSPRRIAAAPAGNFYVTDASTPQLALLTARGETMALYALPEIALAVVNCWGRVLVATPSGRLLNLDSSGVVQGEFALAQGRASRPSGLACHDTLGLLFIAEHDAGRVRAVAQDGTTLFSVTTMGTDPLGPPADVALDTTAGRLLVLLEHNRIGAQKQVHSFALDGTYVGAMVDYGGTTGQVIRGAGLTVGVGGRIYVADGFQSTVQVFDASGTSLGELGSFGTNPGDLQQPAGVIVTVTGDLVVASTGTGRLEVYGQSLPTCPGDTDCDGLPDAWELANGLNPNDPRDARADPDGDGLTNTQEFAAGTNPRNRDTDGDGFLDGEELLAGLNPLDPLDHVPALVALSTVTSDPGLVRLDAQVQGRGSCSVSWTQVAGPPVVLRDPSTATPAFVGRAAATYGFEGTPRCNTVAGLPVVAQAVVRQVAPLSDPGRVAVAKAGESFFLDATASWDGNGDALAFTWDQALGPPRLATTPAAQSWVRAYRAGLYSFQVTAEDAAHRSSSAEVPVLVVDGARPAPTAMVNSPVLGRLGATVELDASESVGPPGVGLQFVWRQVSGPSVTLPSTASRTTFVPPAVGHYRFEVSAREGVQESPWAPVDVYVAATSAGLPVAAAPATRAGIVGEPMTLSGVQSQPVGTGFLDYRWRQVSGAAAGLTNATAPSATVVPFSPGVAIFELVVSQDGMESAPARVIVESDVPGQVRPVALAAGPAVSTARVEVLLDGNGSTGSGNGPLRYRWTQVAGPWVALDDPRAGLAAFTPRLPGLYVFELEVDDGATRSAPSPVGVLVFPAASPGGRP